MAFVFTDADFLFFIDLDHAIVNGQWTKEALAIMARFPGAAMEVSQSGTGGHIFGKGRCGPHKCKNIAAGLELYTEKRFVALTGTNIVGDAGTDHSAALQALVDEFFAPDAVAVAHGDGPDPDWRGPADDDELIRRALASKSAASTFGQRASFADLWERRVDVLAKVYPRGDGYDESSADAALLSHLAFWTGRDAERMHRLMLRSGLVREKWNRPDYLQRSIDSTLARPGDVLKDKGTTAASGFQTEAHQSPPSSEYPRDVSLIRASDVPPERIIWLWNGWLAAGKVHILGGAPGTGKTTIAMALAATVTTGGRWPDGSRPIVGNVVIWSGEDDPADTLIPRLTLAGADLTRVYFIADIREGNERRSFDPARDMEPLRRKLAEIGDVNLLIVDPVVSAIAGDSHKNAEVRRGLQPLVDLAGSMRCALLGITHFTKGTGGRDPVERLTGSLAFGALARVVMVAAKHQEEGEDGRAVRLFCRAKSNIGPDHGGFEYDLHQAELKTHVGIFASSVLWRDPVEGAARDLLATADATGDDGEGGTLADAKRFLADLLSDGPMRAGDVFKDAKHAGYSKRSIQRAANYISVQRHKDGMKGGWSWQLPPKMPEGTEQNCLAPSAPSNCNTHPQ